jgi:integrase
LEKAVPRSNLTQLGVDQIKPPAEGSVTHWDKTLPGFGVRVSAKGRKTWIATYRVSGKPVMQTLGTTIAPAPNRDRGGTLPDLKDARDAARAAMNKAKSGVHPVEERRNAAKAAAAEKAAAEAAAKEAVEGRFEVVVERFLKEHVARKCSPGYAGEVRRIFEHDIMPRWRDRAVRSITKHDVNELLDYKATTRQRPRKGTTGGAAIQANRTLTRLRTFFGWCAANDLIDADPSAGVLLRGKERSRDRHLSEDEILWFWRGAEAAGWPYGPIFKLLMLTGQREGEVAGMRWTEIDLANKVWVIPRERTKSDRAHVVHLSALARDIIDALPRMTGDLVFPSRVGKPITSFGKPHLRLCAAMTAQKQKAIGDDAAEIAPWIVHDLRRTAATVMAERLKVAPHVADKILNHAAREAGTVAAVYNRAAYLDERRAALEALGRYVESLVRPSGSGNVVPLRA